MMTLIQELFGRKHEAPRIPDEKIEQRLDAARRKALASLNAYTDTVQELVEELKAEVHRQRGRDAGRNT